MLVGLEPVLEEERPGRRPRLRRHELDPGRRPRRRQAAGADRPRRGGPALVRPAHAGGAEPDGGRRPRRPALLPVRHGRLEPRGRGHHRRRPHGRRRHGRRRAARSRRSPPGARTRSHRPGSSPAGTSSSPRTGRRTPCPRRSGTLVEVIEAVEMPVVFPVHPRTRAALERAGLLERARAAARLTAPLGYLDFTALLMSAAACLTDSGGVQKEAYLHRVPCVTLRDTTEWVETIAAGWNRLVDLDPAAVAAALASATPPAGASAALRRRRRGRPHRRCHHRRSIASAPHANGRRYRRRGLRGPAAGRRIRPRRALGGVRRGRRAPGRGDRPGRELHRGRRLGGARRAGERGDDHGHRRVRRARRHRRDPDLPADAALDEPRARPDGADGRHLADRPAPAPRAARGARVDQLPGHDA